jgi:EpsI family protein
VLEDAIPKQFGDWRLMPSSALVVNPQTQELLDKLYSQTLSRTYVNSQGYRIMLSLAYGDDQRGGLQAHMPEVCYPAQGFKVHSLQDHVITTPFGQITGKRLSTSLGQRLEPITYWFALGEQAVQSRWEKRLIEIRLGLTGQVPDGLLFRVSSIDPNTEQAYAKHEEFVAALLASAKPAQRVKLAGV